MYELFVNVTWLQNEHSPLYKTEYNGTLVDVGQEKFKYKTVPLILSCQQLDLLLGYHEDLLAHLETV